MPINDQHPTRKCEINETAADGWRRQKTEKMSQESVKFRILFVISKFYRSAGFRGVPGDGWPLDFWPKSQMSAIEVIHTLPNATTRQLFRIPTGRKFGTRESSPDPWIFQPPGVS